MVLSCLRCRDSSTRGADFQNKLHGTGRRVHNATDKIVGNSRTYRCTICKNERTSGG
jgi:hypothetical protein